MRAAAVVFLPPRLVQEEHRWNVGLQRQLPCAAQGLGWFFSVGRVRAGQGNERLNALYLLARSAALVLLALIPLAVFSRPLLGAVTAAMLAVQLIDGGIGLYSKSRPKTAGPLFMALLHAVCLWRLAPL